MEEGQTGNQIKRRTRRRAVSKACVHTSETRTGSSSCKTRTRKSRVTTYMELGAGTDGQLGTERLQDEQLPQLLHLSSLSSPCIVTSLACGGAHVIALTTGGKLLTWGRGSSGLLGYSQVVNYSMYPRPVTSLESYFITNVSADGATLVSFLIMDICSCGDGSFGQLVHGDYKSHSCPVRVLYFSDQHVRQIACSMRHSLAL